MKAQFCVRGNQMLVDYAISHSVPYKRMGKLVVATRIEDIPTLKALRKTAEANGVIDLRWLSGTEAMALEPAINAKAAIHVPTTGVIDSHQLMLSYLGDMQTAGGVLAVNAPVSGIIPDNSGIKVRVGGANPAVITAQYVINAAGLGACDLAHTIKGLNAAHIPQKFYAKGNYFSLRGKAPISRLIYPLPTPASLGCHATIDMSGKVKFGPDVEWVDAPSYAVDENRKNSFVRQIQTYLPSIEPDQLYADYAGVRPKIVGPEHGVTDFRIDGPHKHGIKGLINLFGIESPGLTCSLPIADYVADIANCGEC